MKKANILLLVFSVILICSTSMAVPVSMPLSRKEASTLMEQHQEKVELALEEVGLPKSVRVIDGTSTRFGRPGHYTNT